MTSRAAAIATSIGVSVVALSAATSNAYAGGSFDPNAPRGVSVVATAYPVMLWIMCRMGAAQAVKNCPRRAAVRLGERVS